MEPLIILLLVVILSGVGCHKIKKNRAFPGKVDLDELRLDTVDLLWLAAQYTLVGDEYRVTQCMKRMPQYNDALDFSYLLETPRFETVLR
jgi:hypothetical protein